MCSDTAVVFLALIICVHLSHPEICNWQPGVLLAHAYDNSISHSEFGVVWGAYQEMLLLHQSVTACSRPASMGACDECADVAAGQHLSMCPFGQLLKNWWCSMFISMRWHEPVIIDLWWSERFSQRWADETSRNAMKRFVYFTLFRETDRCKRLWNLTC